MTCAIMAVRLPVRQPEHANGNEREGPPPPSLEVPHPTHSSVPRATSMCTATHLYVPRRQAAVQAPKSLGGVGASDILKIFQPVPLALRVQAKAVCVHTHV